MNSNNLTWKVEQIGYCPERSAFYESIFSLANGYMGIRGFDEEKVDGKGYENCTFIAGIFDYFKPGITDMVNVPNFIYFKITANGRTFSFDDYSIIDYEKVLNMKDGTLKRSFVWQDEYGNRTRIESLKFFSISNKHTACIKYTVTPLNYEGEISIETGINGNVCNNPVNDDQVKNDINPIEYLDNFKIYSDGRTGCLSATTKCTHYNISMAFYLENSSPGMDNSDMECIEEFKTGDREIEKTVKFIGSPNVRYEFNKYIAVFTSRDGVKDPEAESANTLRQCMDDGFEVLYTRNADKWRKMWDVCDVYIDGDDLCQQGIRYNIFNLLQSYDGDNPNISIGARGLTHSRYKGCYFWDTEIFMLPFFMLTRPDAAKNLLMYRYNTIEGARKNARAQNVDGARYAWMCTIDGVEQCDTWDIGLSEVHITADVAYAVSQYASITGDEDFIRDFGAEILIETARYWRSRFTYDTSSGRYNLLFVKGPDEYCGVSCNNTYTVFMAVNNFNLAKDAVKNLKNKYPEKYIELKDKLSFCEEEMNTWDDISQHVNINYDEDKKLYVQDDNFQKLEPCDIRSLKDGNRASYHRVCFDRLQRYRVLKQADVLLLMLLLPKLFKFEEKKAAWEYYEPITLHDSSLSFGTHAQYAASLGLVHKAYDYFVKCVRFDIDDIMENTGKEGLHMASMGSAYQAIVSGFAGISMEDGKISAKPVLPPDWKGLSFSFYYRNNRYRISILKEKEKFETSITLCS